MILKDNLEIILITYNRKNELQKTFDQIFANNSPIKDLQITILDNKSTDGSSTLIEEYREKFPNIKHVIHNRNIGGNANIARAFETASLKYVWILCDDDEYKWDNWSEVENAIEKDYDAIVVANYVNPKKNISQLVKQLTFVPAAIYKTENITDTVMTNVGFSVSNLFSQLAIGCYLLNNNKRIYICENWFVKMVINTGNDSYVRGCDENVHPYYSQIIWYVGYLNTIQMIKDKKLKRELTYNFDVDGNIFFVGLLTLLSINKHSFKNLSDLFVAFSFMQKIIFIMAYFVFLCQEIIVFYKTDNGVHVRLFFKLKIKLIPFKNKKKAVELCQK